MFKVNTRKPIERAIKKLGPKIAKKAINKGARSSAKVFAKEIKKRVPVGKTKVLKSQVKVRAGKRSRNYVNISASTGIGETANAGKGFYGSFIEMGRGPAGWHQGSVKPQPYLVPSYDAKKREAQKTFNATVNSEVNKILKS